ncbi:RNA polymerase, sigma 70 subunit, RpoD subfamily [Thermodesulfatator indicus DSM 15286]|uniref:RNA polymerase sigma factor n=1 Tax=Thermodesulfatator indicus (strain DSM 15286 / JCM 11887 / CIR29812) TaxID=667014 RepID=F8A8A8_THEID|nr:sigma-70 family RNA polymerase sigma factor [Thermodesulfatator indicus]AEH44694.1 RNA polymerase, sigma 70 subunit, RpoD subfamily [Thermodesulfatator indicus DSM 15286]
MKKKTKVQNLEEKLLEAGKDGAITYEALNDLLPEEFGDPKKIEAIFDFLYKNNIEVLDEKELFEKDHPDWPERSPEKKIEEVVTQEEEEPIAASESEEVTSAYLREMGKYELLTPEKEEELSKIIRGGFQFIVNSIMEHPSELPEMEELREQIRLWKKRDPGLKPKKSHLNIMVRTVQEIHKKYPEDESIAELCRAIEERAAQVEKAKDEMVKANLRLVVSIAKRYMGQGLSLADLIQEGNLGLMRAVFRFDYSKGNKFSTYASWWIRQAITRAILDKTRTIRLPVHFLELRSQFFKAFYELVKELGREPTPAEISERTGIPQEKILAIFEASKEPVSLELPIGDEDSTLGDFIENKESPSPFEQVKDRDLSEKVRNLLSTLSPREEKIIRLRFGIGEESEYTLEEIGKRFGVSRERIRQIEKKALSRLRQMTKKDHYKYYSD